MDGQDAQVSCFPSCLEMVLIKTDAQGHGITIGLSLFFHLNKRGRGAINMDGQDAQVSCFPSCLEMVLIKTDDQGHGITIGLSLFFPFFPPE